MQVFKNKLRLQAEFIFISIIMKFPRRKFYYKQDQRYKNFCYLQISLSMQSDFYVDMQTVEFLNIPVSKYLLKANFNVKFQYEICYCLSITYV